VDTQIPKPDATNIIDLTNSPEKNAGDLNTELESCKNERNSGLYVFRYPRPDEFQFSPYLDSYIFWEAEHSFVIFQRFEDFRNNMHGKRRLRCLSWNSAEKMVFDVDGHTLPVQFSVDRWDPSWYCPASTCQGIGVDIFGWENQAMGFSHTNYNHSNHRHLFWHSTDNFTIFHRYTQFSFQVLSGCALRLTRPDILFQPRRRFAMKA
jgi:hypothetical protein